MPRYPPLITINVNIHRAEKKYKVEIYQTPWSNKYRVRLNRKNSLKFTEGTLSEVFNLLRKMTFLLLKFEMKEK